MSGYGAGTWSRTVGTPVDGPLCWAESPAFIKDIPWERCNLGHGHLGPHRANPTGIGTVWDDVPTAAVIAEKDAEIARLRRELTARGLARVANPPGVKP